MNTPNTRFGKDKIAEMLRDCKQLFFVGIGGVNMSSLAAISAARGFLVSGSDRSRSPVTDDLEAHGIKVYHSHDSANIEGADALIYTVSVPTDNPEYAEAGRLGIPRISRADFLGWLMSGSPVRLAVSGMHGKSTTTGMCASIMMASGCDPTICSGAAMPELGCTYRVGKGRYFLIEACEYKDSFLSFYPTHAAILNIEMDHPDYFADIDQVRWSFSQYMKLIDERAVVNWSDENVRLVSTGHEDKLIRFGTALDEEPRPRCEYDVYADDISLTPHSAEFKLITSDHGELHITLAEPGIHNVRDAVAAAALTLSAGISPDAVVSGLASFRGAARRLELIGKTPRGADVYIDYAHHPTEIKATLDTARLFGGHIFTVFQPHTYTRTKAFFNDFAEALTLSDEVILADIYAAREEDIYGVNSEMLSAEVNRLGGDCTYSGDIDCDGSEFERIAANVGSRAKTGDSIILMGAGTINDTTKYLVD